MLSIIYSIVSVVSLVCALIEGKLSALSAAVTTGATQGFSLCLTIAGAICLWNALFRVVEVLGLSEKLATFFSPFLRRIYPSSFRDPACRNAITGNFISNLLGIGNAATPMGIEAVRRMAKKTKDGFASDEICRMVVMNTASVQLIPTSVASIRTSLGAAHTFDILPAVWISSAVSVSCGLFAAFLFAKWFRR